MNKTKINKYLINGFPSLFNSYKDYHNFNVFFLNPRNKSFNIIKNYFLFLKYSFTRKYISYNIVHINCWENFLNHWNKKGKIIIGESHGFHFGLNFGNTLKHFHGSKKVMAFFVELIVGKTIRYRIKKFDIYYVSTPNMLKVVKGIRPDVRWLPNSIDFTIFNPDGKKAVMKGNPIVFYPTRIHSFKNPTFGIELFYKIKKKYPQAVLHLIHYPNGGDELYTKYRKELVDDSSYVWHSFKTKRELSEMYKAADIVLGHFHPDLGMLSGVELQAISCGTAVISYDKYEINTHLNDLEKITFDILNSKIFYDHFVNNCRMEILKNHSADNISKIITSDISRVQNNIFLKKFSSELCIKHEQEILAIEENLFSNIGTWDMINFTREYYNKSECSYLLFKGDKVIGYIIGHSDKKYGYVNRIAISNKEGGMGLGNYLMTCFHDNLKYNQGINSVELVSHKSLGVDRFYSSMGYSELMNDKDITDFLKRKGKESEKIKYTGNDGSMQIFTKSI